MRRILLALAVTLLATPAFGQHQLREGAKAPAEVFGTPLVGKCADGTTICAAKFDADGSLLTSATLVGGGDASSANQTAVQAAPGSDATKAVAVQGVTSGTPVDVNCVTGCSGSGGTGDASAANQTELLSRIGEVQASPTANTLLDRVKTLDASIQATKTAVEAVEAAVGAISSASTVADGADVALGSKADAACASPASSCSLIAGVKALVAAAQDTTPVTVQGSVAHDSADSGAPLKIGGKAASALPTAVASGDRVDALYDTSGRQVTSPALRSQLGKQFTTISNASAETTIITAGSAGVFKDVYGLVITNSSSSDGSCIIKDATGGSTVLTVAVKAGQTGGFMGQPGGATPQATAANNWTATCTSLDAWSITAWFVATKG